jgi:hypothetical protein
MSAMRPEGSIGHEMGSRSAPTLPGVVNVVSRLEGVNRQNL